LASIARRPDGRWRARYRDEAGRERSRHFTRRADAQQWLDQVTTAVVTGQYVDPEAGRITFREYFQQWAERQLWERTTAKAMSLAARTTTFGDLPMRQLQRSHLEQWVKATDAQGLAPGTIKTRFNNVRSVLRAAVRDRVIATDPGERVALPRPRRRDHAMRLPTTAQVRDVLAWSDDRFATLFALCAFAGLRLGEAAAVQVGDVDFLRRQLHVRRQVQRGDGGQVEIRLPKYGSERVVFLPDPLVAQVSRHVSLYCRGDDPTRWLFATRPGDAPPHQNTVGHQWQQACSRADVTGVALQDLRHFYASGLIAAGCDVVTFQRALSHARETTTRNTYAHLWPTAEDRTRRAAGDLLAGVLPILADRVRTNERP
jgi:integrase